MNSISPFKQTRKEQKTSLGLNNAQFDFIRNCVSRDTGVAIEDVVLTINDKIRYLPAKKAALSAQRLRISKTVLIADKFRGITNVCKETGITTRLDIPRIPGFYFEYTSPLASIDNCRDIAKRGASYLSFLDTNVIAGILLTLADDYNLFSFAPSETGASKNAIIRTCGKLTIINAILFIEENIHSENYATLPRLSFLLDSALTQGSFEARLSNWLKIVEDALKNPISTFTQTNKTTLQGAGYIKIADQKKALAQKNSIERKAKLFHKRTLNDEIENVKSLYKDALITKKRRDFLISILDPILFDTMPSDVKSMIALNLATLPQDSRIVSLAKLFERPIGLSENIDDIFALEDADNSNAAKIETQKQIKMKTAFDLQNSTAYLETVRKNRETTKAARSFLFHDTPELKKIMKPTDGFLLLTHRVSSKLAQEKIMNPIIVVSSTSIASFHIEEIVEEIKEKKINGFEPHIEKKQEEKPANWNTMSRVQQIIWSKKNVA